MEAKKELGDRPASISGNRFERHRVAAWVLTLAVLTLVVEVLLRVVDPEAVKFAKEFREVYRYHPRWYTDFEPNTSANIRLTDAQSGYYLNFLVTVNEFGFRWHDRRLDAALPNPNQNEIVHAIGDSFTMGWGVNYESSYPALLTEALGASYAVLNLGLNGYGTIGATEKSIELMDRFPPRAVVYLFTENDYEDDTAATQHTLRPEVIHIALDALNALRRHTYLASVPYALRWWWYFRPSRLADDGAPAVSNTQPSIELQALPERADPQFGRASKRALLRYLEVLRKVDTRLIVVAHGEGPAAADFARFSTENSVETYLVAFDERLLLRREGHLNRPGNRMLAEFVKELLGPSSPEPEAAGRDGSNVFEHLNALCAQAPPTANGLVFLPYLNNGS